MKIKSPMSSVSPSKYDYDLYINDKAIDVPSNI